MFRLAALDGAAEEAAGEEAELDCPALVVLPDAEAFAGAATRISV